MEKTVYNGREYPTPGGWVISWAEGDVVSWRHEPEDGNPRIHDGATAHLFIARESFGMPTYHLTVNGEKVERISGTGTPENALSQIGELLKKHEPETEQ